MFLRCFLFFKLKNAILNCILDESYVEKLIRTNEISEGERMRVAKNSKGDIPVSEWPEQEIHFNINKNQLRKFKKSGRRKTNYECYVPLAKFFVVGNAFVIQVIKEEHYHNDENIKQSNFQQNDNDQEIFMADKDEGNGMEYEDTSKKSDDLHLLKIHDFPAGKMLSIPLNEDNTAFVPIKFV